MKLIIIAKWNTVRAYIIQQKDFTCHNGELRVQMPERRTIYTNCTMLPACVMKGCSILSENTNNTPQLLLAFLLMAMEESAQKDEDTHDHRMHAPVKLFVLPTSREFQLRLSSSPCQRTPTLDGLEILFRLLNNQE